MPNQILTDMTDFGVLKTCFIPTQTGQLLHNVDFLSSGGDKKKTRANLKYIEQLHRGSVM